jgi:hypothetical protein
MADLASGMLRIARVPVNVGNMKETEVQSHEQTVQATDAARQLGRSVPRRRRN